MENDPDQEVADQGEDSQDWRQEVLRNAENHPGPEGTTASLLSVREVTPRKSTHQRRWKPEPDLSKTGSGYWLVLPERPSFLKRSLTAVVIDISHFVYY